MTSFTTQATTIQPTRGPIEKRNGSERAIGPWPAFAAAAVFVPIALVATVFLAHATAEAVEGIWNGVPWLWHAMIALPMTLVTAAWGLAVMGQWMPWAVFGRMAAVGPVLAAVALVVSLFFVCAGGVNLTAPIALWLVALLAASVVAHFVADAVAGRDPESGAGAAA